MTAATPSPLLRRLQFSGLLIALGLVVEAVTLFWSHPTAFLVFLGLGGLLVGLGVLLYLLGIVTYPSSPAQS